MEPQSLITFLNEIEDTRKAKGKRHEQLSIITIMIIAMMCGKNSLKSIARFAKLHAIELAKNIPLPRKKAPSYSTIQRTVHRLNCNAVCEKFNRWMAQYEILEPIAVNGKSIISTITNANNGEQSFVLLVSFFEQIRQLIYTVGFLENDTSSEIQVVQKLIASMQITKDIFTINDL